MEDKLKKRFDEIMQYIDCTINLEDDLWNLILKAITDSKLELLETYFDEDDFPITKEYVRGIYNFIRKTDKDYV